LLVCRRNAIRSGNPCAREAEREGHVRADNRDREAIAASDDAKLFMITDRDALSRLGMLRDETRD